jgi:predicted GNAT family N-acyltransferase
VTIERVEVDVIRPLRHAVLRPNLPTAASAYEQDDDPDTVHLAAYDGMGAVIGCVTVFPEPYADEPAAWRLRGMATSPDVRGTGVGRALLLACLEEMGNRQVPLLWCNARDTAEGFYARHGFLPVGELFDVPDAGIHRRMYVRLR